jgi:endonuclease/exonuclease/phosphatase family metal-dependent hydrolase
MALNGINPVTETTLKALNDLGLVSAYHLSRREDFGRENLATYFHHKKSDNAFHIDYIYSNFGTPLKVDVGLFLEWSQLSDHVPLSAQFDL